MVTDIRARFEQGKQLFKEKKLMSEDFTLEKLKVCERLQAVETKIDLLIPEIQASNKQLTSIITGNGKPETGLSYRVGVLESDKMTLGRKLSAIAVVIGLTISGVCVDLVHNIFFRGPGK